MPWGKQQNGFRRLTRLPWAVKETSQGTFAKGVDTKWPETQTVAKGVTSLLPRKSEDIFLFKENASVPPRG